MIRLRIAGVPEHFNLPWHRALERGAFAEAGIDVQWRTVPEGTGAMCRMLREGEVDMAVLITEGAVRDILHGNPSRIVSNYVDSPLTWGVHVGARSILHTAHDLKQIPFAISRFNSGSHLMALAYAQKQGWHPEEKDFIIVNDLAGAVERMRSGAPMVFLWEKFITASLVHQGLLRRVDEYRAPWPCFVVVARKEVLEAGPEAVRRVLHIAQAEAQALMASAHAAELIAQRYAMTLRDAREWFSAVRWSVDERMDLGAFTVVMDMLYSAGALPEVIEMATEEGRLVSPL